MSMSEAKDWVLVVSGSISMLSVAVGIWMSLREYRLKIRSETRQQKSAEIEAEIRLQTLFSEIMKTANGRSGYQLSEKAAEFFLQNIKLEGEVDVDNLNRSLADLAVLTLPVGSAAQDAAVAAISSLAIRYDVLRSPGLRALESLCDPVTSKHAAKYLADLKGVIATSSALGSNVVS